MMNSYKQLTQDVMVNLAPAQGRSAGHEGFRRYGQGRDCRWNAGCQDSERSRSRLAAACCDGCIAFHTKALVKLGATEAEVHETLGVAIYMGGGPSAMYASNAVAAFNEFSALAHNASCRTGFRAVGSH